MGAQSGERDRRRIRFRRRRIFEAYLAAVPLTLALAFAVSILVPALIELVFAVAIATWFAGSLIAPVFLAIDARETARDISIPLLGLVGLVVPLPTICLYLRGDPTPTPPGSFASRAWLVVATGCAGWVGYFAGELVALYGIATGTGQTITGLTVLLPGAVGLLIFGLLPVAVYADTKYVRQNGTGWEPSPTLRYLLTLAFFSPLVVVLPVYVAYHLYRRRAALHGSG